MRKYGESKTNRIIMATVPHVTSGLGLRKFQADGFLLTRVYMQTGEQTDRQADMMNLIRTLRDDANAPKTDKYSAQGTENNNGGKDRGIL